MTPQIYNQQNLECGKLQTDDPVSPKINNKNGKKPNTKEGTCRQM